MEASSQPQEREISYESALAEEGKTLGSPEAPMPRPRPGQPQAQDAPQAAPQPAPAPPEQPQAQSAPPPSEDPEQATAAENAREEIDILTPKMAAREWTFGKGEVSRTYIQRELSVIAKTQWFSLVGEILDKALGGENSLSLNSLLAPPPGVRPGTNLRMQDFQDADTFVHAIGKLLIFAPEFLEKSICIWLAVPDYEWDLVRELMRQSPDLGGLSDDDAEEVIATFIDQNYTSLDRFFRNRFGNLRDRWNARAQEARSRSPRR